MDEVKLHEPYELRQIDLSVLQAKLRQDDRGYYYAAITNPEYKLKVISPHNRDKDRLRLLLKYRLFKYLLSKNKVRYCECGNLIQDERRFVDICNSCLRRQND